MIHPTAVVHPDVELGVNPWIGPYAVVGWPGESRQIPIGDHPYGRVRVGDNAVIHELAHIQSGLYGTTVIGDGLLLMAYGHISHDCQIGNMVQVSTGAVLGGHTILDDYANVGLNAVTHQKAHIRTGTLLGAHAMLKGETGEWEVWYGVPARCEGPNRIGLERWAK